MKKLFIIFSFLLAVFFGPSILAHPTVKSGNSGTFNAAKVNATLNAEGRPVSSAFDPKVFLNDIRKRVGTRSYMEHWTSKTGDVGDWVCANDHTFSPAESFMGNICFWREGTEWLFMYEYWAAPSLRSYWYTGLASGPSLDEFVGITCTTAKVSKTTYPTPTTWKCIIKNMEQGNNSVAATLRNGFTSTNKVMTR